ncbi:MAG: hypothetical protein NNA23_03455 [Nitrospira sp.]|nr:hypothetical protein [Nitrospira sp.]MCP9463409.1 hypothetical protein [Nitrospira sp.]
MAISSARRRGICYSRLAYTRFSSKIVESSTLAPSEHHQKWTIAVRWRQVCKMPLVNGKDERLGVVGRFVESSL